MGLNIYFIRNVLKTFAKSLGISYHHMDVAMGVLVVVHVDVALPGTALGLCISVLVIAFGLKYTEGPWGILAPR